MKTVLIGISLLFIFGCSERSSYTNYKYNSPEQSGYLKVAYDEQETGPGLVLIKGGHFNYSFNNQNKKVLIPSFYMDKTEVSNQAWLDYLHWTKRVFTDFQLVYTAALPDEKVWLEEGAYNEPKADNYLRHPAYQEYPVVGISWLQANNYCKWRTDRVNEYILIREGILLWNNDQQNEPFTTSAYLEGQYSASDNPRGQALDFDPSNGSGRTYRVRDLANRHIKIEDGILLPKYRLPTAAEWEYASAIQTSKKGVFYPWNGKIHKNKSATVHMGMQSDKQISNLTPNNSFWPNDYGLYNMQGNVSEWVMDCYLADGKISNYSPFVNGNQVLTKKLNSEGRTDEKLDEALYDVGGISKFLTNLIEERKKIRRGIVTDSLDFKLLHEVDSFVKIALDIWINNRQLEASRMLREIVEAKLPEIGFRIQSETGFEDFQYEIIPVITRGISNFILQPPGDIVYRPLKPEELTVKKYKLTPAMIKFIPTLEFDLDQEFNTENRIFKGRNWRDTSEVTETRYLNKYLSSSTIGFRCAMDRLGAVKD